MSNENSYTRTLSRTVDTLGSIEAAAAALSVPVADLEQWLAGKAQPSTKVFLAALDIVATGQYRKRQSKADQ